MISDPYDCLKRSKADQVGVRINERRKTEEGLIVFHTVVENKVVAIDLDGKVLAEFRTCPEGYDIYRPARPGRRASIITILTSRQNRNRRVIAELNLNGEVIWQTKHRWFTHDFHILKNMHVLSVVRENRTIAKTKFSDTTLVELDTGGNVKWHWSLWDHVDELERGREIRKNILDGHTNNPFHINSIQYVDSHFSQKNFGEPVIVISARNINTILLVGRKSEKVLYEINNVTLGQHHARLLPDAFPGRGNIIVFDNGLSFWPGEKIQRQSRIIEYNFLTKDVVWKYDALGFFSPIVGAQQRFPAGNTLITEGYYGRIFEVTYEGEIVWDYIYPEANSIKDHPKQLYEAGVRQIYRAYKVDHSWFE